MSKKLTQLEVCERIKETFCENVELVSEYVNKRSNITLYCNDCGHTWETVAANVLYSNRVNAHHCPNCLEKDFEKVRFKTNCAYCGKEIIRVKSDMESNKTGLFYCSKNCGNLHKNKIREESGEWDNSGNYRKKALKTYEHKCAICGYKEDTRILEVHHIDEDRENNKLSNLIILCPNCHKKLTLHLYELSQEHNSLIMLEK